MAPVVCMTDFPMPRTDAAYPYTRRRQRDRHDVGIVEKYRTLEMRRVSVARDGIISPHGAKISSSCPISIRHTSTDANFRNNHLKSLFTTRIPIEREEQWIILKRRAGLLNIVARTLDLVRRNHILEKKVEALRLETRSFVNSVLNNPENISKNVRIQKSSLCRDEKINNTVTSTTSEKSLASVSSVFSTDEKSKNSRRRIFNDRDDENFEKTSLELETRSSERMVH